LGVVQHHAVQAIAQAQKAARLVLQVIGKIFAARDRTEGENDLLGPDQFLGHLACEVGFGIAVDDHRVAPLVLDLDLAAVRAHLVAHQVRDALLQAVAHLGAEGADAQAQGGEFGNHVRGLARVHRANGHHRCLCGIDVARDHGLQGHDQTARNHHRVHRLVRPCGMATTANHLDAAGVRGRHERPLAEHEGALRRARVVVHAKNRVTGKALEQAIGNHLLRTAVFTGLFGRLKHQVHRALKLPRFGQLLRGPHQHGRMAIVTTGVHGARMGAGIGLAGFFVDWQGVHVGTQGNAPAFSVAQRGHQAMPAHVAGDAVTPAFEPVPHPLRGGLFLKRQFRKFVQVLACFTQRGLGLEQVRDLAKTGVACVHFRLST
jgi:hypothetical protein